MASASFGLIEEILRAAKAAGASDVHLAAGTSPRMRVRGVLSAMNASKLTPADTLDIVLSVMPEARRGRFEERGEDTFSFSVPNLGRCRASVYRQRENIALALRLMDEEIPSPEKLGIPESVMELCRQKQGLVLAAGPSGSGKSTTLAAMIDRINDERDAAVITLEKPIEYLHRHKRSMVSQREIGSDSGSYADALAAALREDADVILVGDLGDPETVSGAIEAAETGRLVFAGFPAASAGSAVERLVDMFPPYRQERVRARLADVLKAVVFQRLVPSADGSGRMAAFEVLL